RPLLNPQRVPPVTFARDMRLPRRFSDRNTTTARAVTPQPLVSETSRVVRPRPVTLAQHLPLLRGPRDRRRARVGGSARRFSRVRRVQRSLLAIGRDRTKG